MSPFSLRLVALVTLLVAASHSANAGPLYEVEVASGGVISGFGGSLNSGAPGLTWIDSDTWTDPSGFVSTDVDWSLQANQGSLHASAHQVANGTSFPVPNTLATLSRLTIDDLVISGPGGTVNTSINLQLTGTLSAFDADFYPNWGSVEIFGILSTPGAIFFGGDASSVGAGPSGGMLASIASNNVDGVFSHPLNNVPTNTPLTLEISLITRARGGDGAFGDGFGESSSDFVMSFAVGQPVFDLPTGFTADSPDGAIDDNMFTGNSAVPEPSSLALLGMGSLSLCGYGWRRKRKTELSA